MLDLESIFGDAETAQTAVTTTMATGPDPVVDATAAGEAGMDTSPTVLDKYNEECWANISIVDRAYLLGPRKQPIPCPWCGGRTRHGEMCAELHRFWEPALSFGKHRGKRLSDVPPDYLDWLLKNGH